MADRSEEMKNEPSSSPLPPVVLLLEFRGSLGEGECVIEAREPLLRFDPDLLGIRHCEHSGDE